MKKFLKIAVTALCLLSLTVFAASCSSCAGKEATGYAYGLVHNYYVGMATVKRNGDKVVSVKIEEMEGPASWAKKSNIKTEFTEGVEFTEGGFAKQITIGTMTFTATDNENAKTPAYKQSEDGETFEEWVKKDENAKFYFQQMSDGNYRILKADGTAGEMDFNTDANGLKKGERWLKSKNGYWSGENFPLGWQGNMDKITDYLVRNGFSSYTGNESKDSTWVIDGVDTGATLVDFHDYMKLAKAAYEKAM